MGRDKNADTPPHSRGANRTRALQEPVSLIKEGAGNAGRATHPQPRVRKDKKAHERSHRGTPTRSGIPCTMGYGLLRALAGVPGLLASVAPGRLTRGLIPASGDHNHTT